MTANLVAGLDPGRSKCGLVLADVAVQQILEAAIPAPEAARALLDTWRQQGLTRVVLGNGTGSGAWHGPLARLGLEVVLVNEHGTTLAARSRYWELYPPGPWMRLLPRGLRLPPRDIDDVVAQLLVERHSGLQLQRQAAKSAPAP